MATNCANLNCGAPLPNGRVVYHTTTCARQDNTNLTTLRGALAASQQRVTDLTNQNAALSAQQTANSSAITSEQSRQTTISSQISALQTNLNAAAVAGENV